MGLSSIWHWLILVATAIIFMFPYFSVTKRAAFPAGRYLTCHFGVHRELDHDLGVRAREVADCRSGLFRKTASLGLKAPLSPP